MDAHIGRSLDEVERELVLGTLMRCGGNTTWTADILGISPRTLRIKLNRYSVGGARDLTLTLQENSVMDEDALLARLEAYNPGTSMPS